MRRHGRRMVQAGGGGGRRCARMTKQAGNARAPYARPSTYDGASPPPLRVALTHTYTERSGARSPFPRRGSLRPRGPPGAIKQHALMMLSTLFTTRALFVLVFFSFLFLIEGVTLTHLSKQCTNARIHILAVWSWTLGKGAGCGRAPTGRLRGALVAPSVVGAGGAKSPLGSWHLVSRAAHPGDATHTGRPTVEQMPPGRWDDVPRTQRWTQRAVHSGALATER